MDYFTITGWLGVLIFIISYILLGLEVLSAKKSLYHWLNFIGALCLVVNAIGIKDHPTITVNSIWGLIALLTVIKIYTRKELRKTK